MIFRNDGYNRSVNLKIQKLCLQISYRVTQYMLGPIFRPLTWSLDVFLRV